MPTEDPARSALDAAVACLLSQQSPSGWWKGELETNVTMDAEDLLLREFLGVRTQERTEAAARWIRRSQRPDGTWATFYEGPPDLSVCVEAYAALRLAGDPPEADHMQKAAHFIRESGGVPKSRVFTRFWLALFGLWPWDDLPVLPPEIVLLPSWAPLSIYDFGCWARQTVVALSVVAAHRPVRPLSFALDEIGGPPPQRPPAGSFAKRLFLGLDAVLRAHEKLPIKPLRRAALRKAERWIVLRQEADGCWGGIQPPWVYSILALHLLGYPLDHPVLAKAMTGLEGFSVWDGDEVRLEACQSPVWDTALAVIALSDSGLDRSHPALESAGGWLLGQEVRRKGDWSVRRPKTPPGGWAFEFENDSYPDVDDSAEVVLALNRLGSSEELEAAVGRALVWIRGMRCADGGWAAFDADNTSRLVQALPFCDFGEVTDPPSADVTAHVVEMLASLRRFRAEREEGVEWLWRSQEEDGSWFGRWGANYVYGTGAVVVALAEAGISPSDPRLLRALTWLKSHQNPDGGWGEDMRSYDSQEWHGRGASTASQTAWALMAFLACGERSCEAVARGVGFLCATQGPGGSWEEPWFTGTGFPGDFYINYHLYRLVFPVMALGRYVKEGSS